MVKAESGRDSGTICQAAVLVNLLGFLTTDFNFVDETFQGFQSIIYSCISLMLL